MYVYGIIRKYLSHFLIFLFFFFLKFLILIISLKQANGSESSRSHSQLGKCQLQPHLTLAEDGNCILQAIRGTSGVSTCTLRFGSMAESERF